MSDFKLFCLQLCGIACQSGYVPAPLLVYNLMLNLLWVLNFDSYIW